MRRPRAMPGAAALWLSICLALAGCQPRSAAPDGALTGAWLLLEINRGGEDINLDHLEGAVRHIDAERYSIEPASGTTITGDYSVDPEARPRTIDMAVHNGRFAGGTLKGIYRVEGDRLTISFGAPGEERPQAFESTPGTQHTVAVHERVE